MKKVDSVIACLETNSIAFGYRVLGEVAAMSHSRILEASPSGRGFFILLTGARDDLSSVVHEVRHRLDPNSWVDSEVVESKDPRVLEALYALPQESLAESLVVVECETISGCLAAAVTLVEGHGLAPIELRIQRSTSGGAYGFFTGSAQQCGPAAEEIRHKLAASGRKGRVEVIDRPSKAFRAFFELENNK